jgi:phosphoribosylamine---glycine ligase
LEGREISVHVLTDGKNVSVFPASRDHKPLLDKNRGPNTGGMGTVAPVPNVTDEQLEMITKTIVMPVINGMRKRGTLFTGLLYPGLMMTKDGPKVLEFNVRFGDPEIQSYVRLLKTDLFEIFMACAKGELKKVKVEWEKKSACCIVLASGGYPGTYKKGEIVYGLGKAEKQKDIVVFHAGTKNINGKICTNGGRVLGISAVGETLNEALDKAYAVIGNGHIHFANMKYRGDIGRI